MEVETLAIFAKETEAAAIVAAKEPIPVPVTSPVNVIVWSPVLVPDKLLAEMAPEKVFAPAKVWVPVVTTPRAVALALGKLKVCVVPELSMAKSVPVVPVENV